MSGRCLLAKTADAGSQGRLKCARAMKKNTNSLGWLPCFRVKTVVPAKEGTTVGKRILDLEKGITNDCNWYGLLLINSLFASGVTTGSNSRVF